MGKITDYSEATRLDDGDIFLKDGKSGTKKIKAPNLAYDLAGSISAINHRNTYRGKNLGSSVSATQLATIQAGKFDDIFIGDYWTIGGVNYRVADMDYFFNCGDTNFSKHHLVIVPDGNFGNVVMNDTDITAGGYTGSKMYTEGLNTAKEKITAAFGDMVLTHRDYFTNAVTNGKPSAGAWFDSTVDLMNEIMVYGCHIFAPANDGTTIPTRYTISNSQLSLFRLNPGMIKRRYGYWLRDVVSASQFAYVSNSGGAPYYSLASYTYVGVRPAFVIG